MTNHQRSGISRRGFMVGTAGLTFAVATGLPQHLLVADAAAQTKKKAKNVVLNPWVTIATDGTISIMSPAVEMGQGSFTSLPRILAEELDADWSKVRAVAAPADDAIYGSPLFRYMYTAGSFSVSAYYMPLRRFGAQVRKVLMDNAAEHWGVPVDELTTGPSVVIHRKSGRRLTYGEIAAFAKIPAKAPTVNDRDLKPSSQFRLIGKDVLRVDLPGKVNGTARYSIDVDLPNMAYGAVLRPPVVGAKPDTVDDAKARAVPGVIKVVRLPQGVGIIANSPTAAFAAKNALKVTWTRDGKAWGFDSDKAVTKYAAMARDVQHQGMVWMKEGDALQELQGAATVFESGYSCDFVYHAQMEPLNAVASMSPRGDAVEVWCGTQSQTAPAKAIGPAFGIEKDKIIVHHMQLGGSFGRRANEDVDFVMDAIALSKEAKRPVKMMWTREDDVHNGHFHPLSAHYIRAGLDQSGKVVAIHHRKACDEAMKFYAPNLFQFRKRRDPVSFSGLEAQPYAIPHRLAEALVVTDGIRVAALRGIAFLANTFVIESFMDEIARKRKIDPVDFRRELLGASKPRDLAVIDAVVRKSEWNRKRTDGTALGFGFVDYTGTLVAEVAEVSVDRTTGAIRVHNIWVAFDPGVAVHPDNAVGQIEGSVIYGLGCALSERITFKDGIVQQSNFSDYHVPRMNEIPQIHVEMIVTDNPPTGVGQMGTPLVAPAIANAVAELTGVRLRQMPMTPDRVLAALKA